MHFRRVGSDLSWFGLRCRLWRSLLRLLLRLLEDLPRFLSSLALSSSLERSPRLPSSLLLLCSLPSSFLSAVSAVFRAFSSPRTLFCPLSSSLSLPLSFCLSFSLVFFLDSVFILASGFAAGASLAASPAFGLLLSKCLPGSSFPAGGLPMPSWPAQHNSQLHFSGPITQDSQPAWNVSPSP